MDASEAKKIAATLDYPPPFTEVEASSLSVAPEHGSTDFNEHDQSSVSHNRLDHIIKFKQPNKFTFAKRIGKCASLKQYNAHKGTLASAQSLSDTGGASSSSCAPACPRLDV